jgi:predicted aspartyl protease
MENRVDTLETTVEHEEEIKMHLMLCDYNGEEEEIKKVEGETQEEEEEPAKLKTLKLSLQSKEGFTSNKSFKVWVQIGDRQVVTLIDSSATSNFITTKLVEELQLKVVDTPTYVIEVGNGEKVINQGVCNDLSFKIQDVEFIQQFFIMDLGGSEMMLGMDWLASLCNI